MWLIEVGRCWNVNNEPISEQVASMFVCLCHKTVKALQSLWPTFTTGLVHLVFFRFSHGIVDSRWHHMADDTSPITYESTESNGLIMLKMNEHHSSIVYHRPSLRESRKKRESFPCYGVIVHWPRHLRSSNIFVPTRMFFSLDIIGTDNFVIETN